MRPSGRHADELRKIEIELQVNKHAEGSCLIKCGNTHVLCTATVENKVPPFLRGQGKGWVTAEYGMLPRATGRRMERESVRGGQAGRTQEIQRLIGRSLRAVTDLNSLGERQIIVDCDVIQADGGTRCASITGGYVALYLAISKLMRTGQLENMPLYTELAAVSCGIYHGKPILDLDYIEDSEAEVDANFIMTSSGGIVEIQGTAEGAPFSEEQLMEMMAHAKKGIGELVALQQKVLRI